MNLNNFFMSGSVTFISVQYKTIFQLENGISNEVCQRFVNFSVKEKLKIRNVLKKMI